MGTMWHGTPVRITAAKTLDGRPIHEVEYHLPDGEVIVSVSYDVDGPIGPDDPPWGPIGESEVRLSEIDGPAEYLYGDCSRPTRCVLRTEEEDQARVARGGCQA